MLSLLRKPLHLANISAQLAEVTHIADEVLPEAVNMTPASKNQIWQSVETLYKTGTQPMISLCIRRQGKIFINRAIGHARGNGPGDKLSLPLVPATVDTPVCLYSSSKAITALLMHKLAEQGEINLLDPVTFYLPEFGKKGKRNITIHQILGHRGGIPGLPVNMPLETIFDADGVWQLLCEAKPIAADGAKLAYHAITGGFVLQRILEKVTGRTIADYLDEHFRKPMSMKYFTYGLATRHRPQVATNYATGPGMPLPLSWIVKRALGASFPIAAELSNSDQWMDAIVPAANIYATAEELCRFYQMLLDGGCWQDSRLLNDTTVKRATQALGGTYIDRTLLIPMRYSAGLMLGGNPIGIYGRYTRCAFGHIGLINKFSWADRERQISVTLLTSGLCLLSHHLPALGKILAQINKQCMPE